MGVWKTIWILTNDAVFQATLVAQSFLKILNPCSVQLLWWYLILLLLQKSFSLGRALATARYSNNLFPPIILFPFHDFLWIEEHCEGPTISLSNKEQRLLSVGYGDRSIQRSPLCDVTNPRWHDSQGLPLKIVHRATPNCFKSQNLTSCICNCS